MILRFLNWLELQRLDQRIAVCARNSKLSRTHRTRTRCSAARAPRRRHKRKTFARADRTEKKFELDVNQWRERARKYRDQSASVKTTKPTRRSSMKSRTRNPKPPPPKTPARTDDGVEETEREIKFAEGALKDAEISLAAVRKQIESQGTAKNSELDADLIEREKIATQIPTKFSIVTRAPRNAITAPRLPKPATEQCRGCGMRLLPHTFQKFAARKITTSFCAKRAAEFCTPWSPLPLQKKERRRARPDGASPAKLKRWRPFRRARAASKIPAYRANIDGGSRGNPGPAAYGVVIRDRAEKLSRD